MTNIFCEKYKIKNYIVNDDGSIDVNGSVELGGIGLKMIPVKFNKVTGDFSVNHNYLKNLRNLPNYIGGDFSCGYNKITTLKGFPKYVGGDIFLYDNKLTSLEGITDRIEKKLDIAKNLLTSLKGCPKWIGGYFLCNDNKLTSLEFSPEYVGSGFFCNNNDLTDLVGSPKQVDGIFFCSNNKKLINPKGCSEKMGDIISCFNTPLESIFDRVDQHFLHAFNFYKIIKDDTVNLKRLKYVMDLYDKPIDLDKIEKYYRLV